MAEQKIQATKQDVHSFLYTLEAAKKQQQAFDLLALFEEVTKCPPVMWGTSMIGFGQYAYCYESGHSGISFRTGFSPRKQNFSLYIMTGVNNYPILLAQLGKYKTGKSCLYINKLADVDMQVLEQLILADWAAMAERYPE